MKKIIWFFLILNMSISAFAQPLNQTFSFKRIGDIAILPDGQQIAYTVSQIVRKN